MFIFTLNKKRGSEKLLIKLAACRQGNVPNPHKANAQTVSGKSDTTQGQKIKQMTFFPLIINEVKLNTNPKEFISALRKLCEKDFDIFRAEKEFSTLYKPDYIKEYEAEISKNSFKARKLDKSGFRPSPFIKNTIYGWYKMDGETLTFKYLITFNIFTSILFLGILFATAYSLYDAFAHLNNSSVNLLISALIGSALFIFIFNIMAEDDKIFVDEIIKKCQ